MTSVKISTLPAAGTLNGTETVPVVQGGVTKGATTSQISDFAAGPGNFLLPTNNLSDLTNATTARTNLGLGSAAVQAAAFFLQSANNLSDVGSAATARSNLGLGTVATENTVPVAKGGTGATTAQAAAEALSTAFVVADLAALKALTARPEAVIVETGQAKGVWQWELGSVTTADDALVVQCTAGTAGRYKRIYDAAYVTFWGSTGAAITAMATALGYVRFPTGSFAVAASVTIDVPMHFDAGAYLTVAAGQTVTIRSRVDSPRQYIFQGDGSYSFEHNPGVQGEDARQAHVSWFGAFPSDSDGDVSPQLQKLTNSMGNLREAHVQFDVGVYYCQSTVTWNRGSKVRGMGRRLTSIACGGAISTTGDLFTTNGAGCEFSDFQPSIIVPNVRTSGAFIRLSHEECRADRIMCVGAFIGVALEADECEARDIRGFVGSGITAAGSRLVQMRSTRCLAETITYTSGGTGPEYVVAIEPNGASPTFNRVRHVYVDSPGTHGVGILNSSTFACSGATVKDVFMEEGGYGVRLLHTGSADANGFDFDGVTAGNNSDGAIDINLTSTGDIRNVLAANITADLCNDDVIAVTNSSTGFVQFFSIGAHNIRGGAGSGIVIGGTTANDSIAIGPGLAATCAGAGYNITATRFALNGVVARTNTGTGILIGAGSTNFSIADCISLGNTAANFTDSSGVAALVGSNDFGQTIGVQTVNTNAAFTLTPRSSAWLVRHTGTLTADRAVTLATTNVKSGDRFKVTRTGGGAFNLNVGTGPLKALATNTWGVFEYDGSAWYLAEFGAL